MFTELVQSGGVQQIAIIPQIIYLDFDGALTAYNGEILAIDNVTVEDSGLTEERIRQITASLNEQFAGQNVLFVSDQSDLSEQSDYSTIYIGKTSSFEPYGSFAGLAETIDSGNRIKNDNAFVILDSTADNAQLINTIAHEAGHLLGTLDHGGEGLQKYGFYQHYDVSSGMTSHSIMVGYGDTMEVWEGGSAEYTTVRDGGCVCIYGGGLAEYTTVSCDGNVYIYSAGTVYSTAVDYGNLYVLSDGTAEYTTVNEYGAMTVSSGGTADSTTINSGTLMVSSGGTATNIIWTPCVGSIDVEDGAVVTYASDYSGVYFGSDNKLLSSSMEMTYGILEGWGCSMFVMSGGVVTTTTVAYGGHLYISNGGIAYNTFVYSGSYIYVFNGGIANGGGIGAYLIVSSGGTVNNMKVFACGNLFVNDDGVINNTTMSGGSLNLGGTANITNINSGGNLYVSSGGTANNTWVNSSGGLFVSSGGTANSTMINSYGKMHVSSGGIANNTTVSGFSATLYVFSGGIANKTILNNGGNLYISSGGIANSTTVVSGGWLNVSSGGVANEIMVNSGGHLYVNSGGSADNVTLNAGAWFDVIVAPETYIQGTYNNSSFVMQKAYLSGYSINSGGNLRVLSGGTADSTTVNSGGDLHVDSGGTATNIIWTPCVGNVCADGGAVVTYTSNYSGVYFGSSSTLLSSSAEMSGKVVSGWNNCSMYVMNYGTANNTTVTSGGGLFVSSGGTADNTNINSWGWLHVSSGGIANNTTVNRNGYLGVFNGGLTNSTTVNSNGSMYVSSGIANNTTVNSGGELKVDSGGVANNTTVNNGGEMNIGNWYDERGTGMANGIIVHSGGYLSVHPGGKVSGSLQIEESATVSADNGAIIDLTVAEHENPETALINDWSLISGGADATYTLTVKADQTSGIYVLADGAADFNKSIIVKTTDDTELGTLNVGETLTWNDVTYTLNKNEGTLSLNLTNVVKDPITITANSASKTYDGTALTASGYTYTGSLLEGDELVVTVSGSQTDAGTGVSTVSGYKVMRGDVDVTDNYTFGQSIAGTLTVTKRDVTLTSADDSKQYDGTPLTNHNVTVSGDGFVEGQSVEYSFTGTQTNVGSSKNSFTYSALAGTNLSNYSITKNEGTLTVTLASADNVKVYSSGTLVKQDKVLTGETIVSRGNDSMYVSSGGTANSTTVGYSAGLFVSSGGTAVDTLILFGGGMIVSSGGMTDNTVIMSNGQKYVRGGTVNSTTVNSCGSMFISGGTANCTALNGGDLHISSGGTANNTTVISCGQMFVSSGIANSTILDWCGGMEVYSGGTANNTLVNGGGMNIFSGGTANSTTVNSDGYMHVFSDGTVNSTTVNSGGSMFISGGTVNCTVLNGGDLHISSGGTANSTTVNSDGYMHIFSDGTANNTTVNSNFIYVHERGIANNTMINSGGYLVVSSGGTVNSTMINSRGYLSVESGGIANRTTVVSGGCLWVSSGGTALAIKENGGCVGADDGVNVTFIPNSFSGLLLSSDDWATLHSGTTANSTTINSGGGLDICGGLANSILISGGVLWVTSSGIANATTVNGSGRMYVSSGGTVSGSLQIASGAVVSAYEGAKIDFTVAEQAATETALINNWSLISGGSNAAYTITVNSDQADGTYVLADGAADFANSITVKTTDDTELGTISTDASLIVGDKLYSLNKQAGALSLNIETMVPIAITANSADKKYDGTALNASGYTYTGTLAAGDELVVTVSGSQTDAGAGVSTVSGYKVMRGDVDVTGNYTFGQSIAGTLTVTKRDVVLTSESDSKVYDGTPLTNHNVIVSGDGFVVGEGYTAAVTGSQTEIGSSANTFSYTLNNGTKADNYNITTKEGTLTVTDNPVPFDLQGTEDGISWKGTAAGYVVEYSTDQFEHVLNLQTTENGVDTFAMPEDTYQWQVRNSDSETWAQSSFSATEKTSPENYVSESNGIGDVFFADADGVWEKKYAAQHLGCGTWSGTKELVELEGRNKITDVFTGSTDANLLVMTDDANGDALFVDDIYSAFPSSQQSRIAQIDEIRAGDGDDIVDMTSQRFAYSGDGLTIRGGDGDDTLWSNLGNNQLFGDAGDDRLVGASGNDVLVGGTGNDSMHGGGGNDVFCFCKGWGKDTVEQLSDGSVTLWFVSGSEDNWDAESMTYTAGANSVKVTGVSEVTLKFGDDGSAQYDDLLAAGAFLDVSSERIFEEKNTGVLAVI